VPRTILLDLPQGEQAHMLAHSDAPGKVI
jgi:hypothetical protein